MTKRPTAMARWAFVFLFMGACAEHEPEVKREGPPIPDADVTVPPQSCTDAGTPSEPIRFCQANIVLSTVCQRCHANPPMNGAPFPLVTYEDTQQVFDMVSGKLRWERMQEVVAVDLMPLMGIPNVEVSPLTCEEKSTLMGWLGQCAQPEGGTTCDDENEVLASCDPQWRRD